jgi:hypothetical protein
VECVCSSPNITEVMKSRRKGLVRHVARMGDKRSEYRAFVGKPDGKRSLRRHQIRWADSIKMYLVESYVYWTVLHLDS